MALLVDLFGYLGIILHGLAIIAQSMALGGVLFLILLARPFAPQLGSDLAARTAPNGSGRNPRQHSGFVWTTGFEPSTRLAIHGAADD